MQILQTYKCPVANRNQAYYCQWKSHLQNNIPSSHGSVLITVTCRVYAAEAVKLRRTTEPLSLLALLCSLELCPYLMYIGAGSGITLMVVSWPWSCSTFSQQSTSACIKMSCRSRGTSLCPLLCWPVTISWSERRKDALNPHFFLVTWIGFAKCGP